MLECPLVQHSIFEDSNFSGKRPRLDGDESDEENVFDKFGMFRESRKSDKNKIDKKVSSVILTDAKTGSSLLRAPLSSVEGMTVQSKFEDSIIFKLNFPETFDSTIISYRFRINFLVITPS